MGGWVGGCVGGLHPGPVELDPLPQDEAVRRVRERVQDHRPRDARHAGIARSGGREPRFREEEGGQFEAEADGDI